MHADELKKYEERIAKARAKWPSGPWNDEPDRVEFEHKGVPCLIVRSPLGGNLCGYVGVKPGHPWHRKNFSDIDADVHGGLTYSEECQRAVCHVPAPGEPENLWWLGFDCAHCDDLTAWHQASPGEQASYRDIPYVTSETKRLAEQVIAAAG